MAAVGRKKNAKTYEVMVTEAVQSLSLHKKGSSVQAIRKFLSNNFSVAAVANHHLKRGLDGAVESGKLLRLTGTGLTGSFRTPRKNKKSPVEPPPNPLKPRKKRQPGAVGRKSGDIPPPSAIKTTKSAGVTETVSSVDDLSAAADSLQIMSEGDDSEEGGLERAGSCSQSSTDATEDEESEDETEDEAHGEVATEEEEPEDAEINLGDSMDRASGAEADDEWEETIRWPDESQYPLHPLTYYRTISAANETGDESAEAADEVSRNS